MMKNPISDIRNNGSKISDLYFDDKNHLIDGKKYSAFDYISLGGCMQFQ